MEFVPMKKAENTMKLPSIKDIKKLQTLSFKDLIDQFNTEFKSEEKITIRHYTNNLMPIYRVFDKEIKRRHSETDRIIKEMNSSLYPDGKGEYKKWADQLDVDCPEGDYWREIFYEGNETEIEYWITDGITRRKPHISEIILIPEKEDKWFYKGLEVADFTNSCVDSDIENMNENEEMSKECKEKRTQALQKYMQRICQFSSDIFGGYQVIINLNSCENTNDIVAFAIKTLKHTLEEYNFEMLVDKLKASKYHIHSEFQHIKNSNDVIWICDHVQ